MPARGIRSRRLRCAGGPPGPGRVDPGLGEDPRHRARATGSAGSASASVSARCTGLNPAYVVRACSTIEAAQSRRRPGWPGCRPRLPCTSPAAPSVRRRSREPAHLAGREPQVRGRLADVELARQHMGQDQEALLRPGVQGDRLPRLHGIEGDKVASGPVDRTSVPRDPLQVSPDDTRPSGRRPTRATIAAPGPFERRSGLRMSGRWSGNGSPNPTGLERNHFTPCSHAPPRMPWRIAKARCAECAVAPPLRPVSTAPPTAAPASSSSTSRAVSPTARSAATPAGSTDPRPGPYARRRLIDVPRPTLGSAVVIPGRRPIRPLAGTGAPTRAQQSKTDQQMSFRNRWSSSTSSRIASGSWSRCHRHSSRPACAPAPSGAAARAALIAYAAAPSSCAATCATTAAWPAAYAACRAAPRRSLAAAIAWPPAARACDIATSPRTHARMCSIA